MINKIRAMENSDEDYDNINYYRKSAERKKWYRKTKSGWIDSFEFDADINNIEVLKNDGTFIKL
jgi:hypothetical protein